MSCFVAHDAAYYDAEILHRDISVGNIMISEGGGGGGFLIDWDMCVRVGLGAQSSPPSLMTLPLAQPGHTSQSIKNPPPPSEIMMFPALISRCRMLAS